MNKRFSKFAAVAALLIVITVLFSFFFVAHEAGHDCCGEDCEICAVMAQCRDNIEQLGSFLLTFMPAFLVGFVLTALPVSRGFCRISPVILKVRMNN